VSARKVAEGFVLSIRVQVITVECLETRSTLILVVDVAGIDIRVVYIVIINILLGLDQYSAPHALGFLQEKVPNCESDNTAHGRDKTGEEVRVLDKELPVSKDLRECLCRVCKVSSQKRAYNLCHSCDKKKKVM
jgi:hypothetical protein